MTAFRPCGNKTRSTLLTLIVVACLSNAMMTAAFVAPNHHHHHHSRTSAQASTSSTTILFSKNSDRAHIERNLEEMMGNDWREFRAKLVAQERAVDAQQKQQQQQQGRVQLPHDGDARLAKHGQLSDLFADAISTIFHKQDSTSSHHHEGNDIFEGTHIAGIDSATTEDPFVSAAELPAVVQKPVTKIDKHRWAHGIPDIEQGCVLLANEKLGGVFHQTVVLIVKHSEQTGSMGVVINRPMPGNLMQVSRNQESNLDLSLKLAFSSSPVTYGGPVMADEYSVIHGFGQVEGSLKLCPGVYVGGSAELIPEVRIHRFDPSQALFVQGHAAWVPGQLSKEIAKGVWYTAAVSSDFILRYAGAPVTENDNPHDLWSDILTCMGGEYAEIAQTHQGRGDMRMP